MITRPMETDYKTYFGDVERLFKGQYGEVGDDVGRTTGLSSDIVARLVHPGWSRSVIGQTPCINDNWRA